MRQSNGFTRPTNSNRSCRMEIDTLCHWKVFHLWRYYGNRYVFSFQLQLVPFCSTPLWAVKAFWITNGSGRENIPKLFFFSAFYFPSPSTRTLLSLNESVGSCLFNCSGRGTYKTWRSSELSKVTWHLLRLGSLPLGFVVARLRRILFTRSEGTL